MENQEKTEDGKSCCSKGKCCGKAVAVIGLLAVGGLGGYFAGRHCGANIAPAAVSAPK